MKHDLAELGGDAWYCTCMEWMSDAGGAECVRSFEEHERESTRWTS